MLIGIAGVAGAGKDTTADFLVKNHGFVKVAFADPLKRICQDVYQFTDAQLWGPSELRNAPDKRYPTGRFGHDAWLCDQCARAAHGHPYEEKTLGRIGGPAPCAVCGEATDDLHYVPAPVFLTPRHALQQLGTEWARHNYPNTWVDYALRTAKRLQEGGCYYDAKSGLRTVSEVDYDRRTGTGGVQARKELAISDVRFKNEIDAIHAAGGKVIRLIRETTLQGEASKHRSEQEQLGFTYDMFDFNIENMGSLNALERMTKMAVNVFLEKSPA
jgi:hypothetical protein